MIATVIERRKKTLVNLETGEKKEFESINKSKKESVRLQEAKGGLGMGHVRVKR